MSTVLYSRCGPFRATIISMPGKSDDGYLFQVMETKKTFAKEYCAIRNGRLFLKKKRKELKEGKIKIKRRRTK